MFYQVTTLHKRPDLKDRLKELEQIAIPQFMQTNNAISWPALYEEFADSTLLFIKDEHVIIAMGFMVPSSWDGSISNLPCSLENILQESLNTLGSSDNNTIMAIGAIVNPDYRRQNLSTELIKEMKKFAKEQGFSKFVAPVRPIMKEKYPLQCLENYAEWVRVDGLYYDPWLRVHQKLGGKVLKCVSSTLFVSMSVKKWEESTGMIFPESGKFIVKGALQPVTIDLKTDIGFYMDPNVWIEHDLS